MPGARTGRGLASPARPGYKRGVKTLTVWTNHRMNAEQEARLRRATAAHRLLLLPEATHDALAGADVAFGQPPVDAARDTPRLAWVQLSSAGYGSYDRADVREAFARRGRRAERP